MLIATSEGKLSMRLRAMVLAALLAGGGHPASGSEAGPPARELIQLTGLVRFLKARLASEVPGPLAPSGLAARLGDELVRLELVPPGSPAPAPDASDLQVAGLVLEEQMRRRRVVERHAVLREAETELSAEVEALLADAEEYVPEFAPEIAAIFKDLKASPRGPAQATDDGSPSIRRDEPEVPTPAEVFEPQAAPSPPPADAGLAALGAELEAALASAGAAPGPGEDPFRGDPRFVVARVVPVRVDAAPLPMPPRSTAPAKSLPPVKSTGPKLAAARPPTRPVPPQAPAPRSVRPKPTAVAATLVEDGSEGYLPRATPAAPVPARPTNALERLIGKVGPELSRQAATDAEYALLLRQALSAFGVQLPEGLEVKRADPAAAQAVQLEASGATSMAAGLEVAVAALGL